MSFKRLLAALIGVVVSVTMALALEPLAEAQEPAEHDNTLSTPHNVNTKTSGNVIVREKDVVINGVTYTPEEFKSKLEDSFRIKDRFAPIAAAPAVYFIPGIGQVLLTATGAVVVAGVTIYAGSWLYRVISTWFREHTKNKRKSTYNKHTKHRPGRASEKKKCKSSWRCRR